MRGNKCRLPALLMKKSKGSSFSSTSLLRSLTDYRQARSSFFTTTLPFPLLDVSGNGNWKWQRKWQDDLWSDLDRWESLWPLEKKLRIWVKRGKLNNTIKNNNDNNGALVLIYPELPAPVRRTVFPSSLAILQNTPKHFLFPTCESEKDIWWKKAVDMLLT